MRIDEALGGSKDLAITFPTGSVLNIVYKPSSYTVEEIASLDGEARKDPRRIIRMVRDVVLKWDLEDRYGIVPLDSPEPARLYDENSRDDGTSVVVKRDIKEIIKEELSRDEIAKRVPVAILTHIIREVNKDQSVSEGE
jgi:hypothetical protein